MVNPFITSVTVFCLLLIFFAGCSDSSVSPEPEEPADTISGIYFMHGFQVNMGFCYLSHFCDSGEILSRDTVQTSFTLQIEKNRQRQDSLRFYGLENAPNSPGDCSHPQSPRDCGFALLKDDLLTFDLLSPGGSYVGSGTLVGGRLTLETRFRYRNRGADYFLEGTKIEGL